MFFLIVGLIFAIGCSYYFIIFLLVFVMMLPPLNRFLLSRFHIKIHGWIKAAVIAIVVPLSIFVAPNMCWQKTTTAYDDGVSRPSIASSKTSSVSKPISNPVSSDDQETIKFVKSDPAYQDYLSLEQKTLDYRYDKEWIDDTINYLAQKAIKWHVDVNHASNVWDAEKYLLERSDIDNSYDSDSLKEKDSRAAIDDTKNSIEYHIFDYIISKKHICLPIDVSQIEKLAESYGFNQVSSGINQDYPYNQIKCKTNISSFIVDTDSSGKIDNIDIPISTDDTVLYNIPSNKSKVTEYYAGYVRRLLSKNPRWLDQCLNMFCSAQQTANIHNRLNEISKLSTADLLKENTTKANDLSTFTFSENYGDLGVDYWCIASSFSLYIRPTVNSKYENFKFKYLYDSANRKKFFAYDKKDVHEINSSDNNSIPEQSGSSKGITESEAIGIVQNYLGNNYQCSSNDRIVLADGSTAYVITAYEKDNSINDEYYVNSEGIIYNTYRDGTLYQALN